MSSIPKDWFEQISSMVKGSNFDRHVIPDHFSVFVSHNGERIAEWDITDELKQNGIANINFTNSTLNVDVSFLFMHEEFKDQLADNKLFQSILDQAKNISEVFGLAGNVTYQFDTDLPLKEFVYTQGIITLLVGIIGLIVKRTERQRPKVVKVTGFAFSTWCIITGVLMLVEQIAMLSHTVPKTTADTIVFIMASVSSVLLKVLLISFKLFTVVIYMFQNTMIYRPFFFRRNKKALSSWVLRISSGQSAGVFVTLIVWSVYLIFNVEDGECYEVQIRTENWRTTIRTLMYGGYFGSLILSLIFTVGFYRKSAKKIGRSESKNINRTMIACSIEVLFDISALVVNEVKRLHCLSVDLLPQDAFASYCDITARLHAIEGGLTYCLFKILAIQPLIQESFVLISDMLGYCSKKQLGR